MPGKEMSPMDFQTRLIKYFYSRGEVDVEDRVASLKDAILAYNNPKLFKEVQTVIEQKDMKLNDLVSKNGSVYAVRLQEVVKTAAKRGEFSIRNYNNSDPFLEEMMENQALKDNELKSKIAALVIINEMMSKDDWKFIAENTELVFDNLTTQQRRDLFRTISKGQEDVGDNLAFIMEVLSRPDASDELTSEDTFIEVKHEEIDEKGQKKTVIRKVKLTEKELKHLQDLKADKKYAGVFVGEDGIYDVDMANQYSIAVTEVKSTIASTDIEKVDFSYAERVLNDVNSRQEKVDLRSGPLDTQQLLSVAIEDVQITRDAIEASFEKSATVFRDAVGEEKDMGPAVVDSYSEGTATGENSIEDFLIQAFDEVQDYFVEPEVSKNPDQEIEEVEADEIDVTDVGDLEQAEPKDYVTEVKGNPIKRLFSTIRNAVGIRKKALPEPEKNIIEGNPEKNEFDSPLSGYDWGDRGVVSAPQIVKSLIYKITNIAKGVFDPNSSNISTSRKKQYLPKNTNTKQNNNNNNNNPWYVPITEQEQRKHAIGVAERMNKKTIIPQRNNSQQDNTR